VTVWNLPGQLGGAALESPDLRENFNRQVQEARRASLPNATIRLNFTSATPGTITVRDIRIAYDLPPVILHRDPAGPASVEEGGSLAFGVAAADQDNDPLGSRWLLDGLPVDEGSLSFVYRPDFASSGVHNLTVVVSDGTLSASATWLVSVADVNRPPVIEGYSPEDRQVLGTREAARFDVRASDPDGSPLSYAWRLDGEPTGASDRSFDYVAPAAPGVHTVRVEVSDGQDSVNRTWTVEVFRPAVPDGPKTGFPFVQLAAGILLAMALVLAVALLVRRPPGGGRRARRPGRPARRGGASVKLKNGNANQPQQ
jgi:hypothetical protein